MISRRQSLKTFAAAGIAPAASAAQKKAGIPNVFFDCPFAHEWQTWRYDLQDFAPRLFR